MTKLLYYQKKTKSKSRSKGSDVRKTRVKSKGGRKYICRVVRKCVKGPKVPKKQRYIKKKRVCKTKKVWGFTPKPKTQVKSKSKTQVKSKSKKSKLSKIKSKISKVKSKLQKVLKSLGKKKSKTEDAAVLSKSPKTKSKGGKKGGYKSKVKYGRWYVKEKRCCKKIYQCVTKGFGEDDECEYLRTGRCTTKISRKYYK